MEDEPEEKTKCQYCMTGCKQLITFLLSHVGLVTLVVGYCLIGAVTFEALEAGHEREVFESIFKKSYMHFIIYFLINILFFAGKRKDGKSARSSLPRPLDNDQKN